MEKFGFLREDDESAVKAGVDSATNLCRTGLNKYLKVIFPDIDDWVHDKIFGLTKSGEISRRRPDYRSDSLKLIVEFDGVQHYNNPVNILRDIENTRFYENEGYKVIRVPFFIQLTNKVVKKMFGIDVKEQLFPDGIASLSVETKCTPAFFCPLGIKRMAKEFVIHPEQYQININKLLSYDNIELSGVNYLQDEYSKLIDSTPQN